MDTTVKGGLLWPASDEICFDAIQKDIFFMRRAVEMCEKRRTVVQAGGNAGMYPLEFAKHFDKVVTFEPDALNFHCLTENTRMQSNVEAHNGVLGDCNDPVALHGWLPNCGAWEVSGPGDIPQITLDELGLKDVDLIQLDVQGFEGRVLEGGRKTIERCMPMIILEEGYGVTPTAFLQEFGYEAADVSTTKGRIRDTIYASKQQPKGTGSRGGKRSEKETTTDRDAE